VEGNGGVFISFQLTSNMKHVLSNISQRSPCTDCKSAQQCTTRGHPYHSPKLHPGPYNSVGMRPQTDRHTDTQTRVTTKHFAYATHAKCNDVCRGETCVGPMVAHGIRRSADSRLAGDMIMWTGPVDYRGGPLAVPCTYCISNSVYSPGKHSTLPDHRTCPN